MIRHSRLILALGWLVLIVSGAASQDEEAIEKAVAEIKKIGGKLEIEINAKTKAQMITGIDFSGTELSDAGLVHLKVLPDLKRGRVRNTKISDKAMHHLKELTKLEKLDLRDTHVSDNGLELVQNLVNLKDLDLAHTDITNVGPRYLKSLTKLQVLNLEGVPVTNSTLEHFKGFTQMNSLILRDTKITDAGMEFIVPMFRMQKLDLGNTRVGSDGLAPPDDKGKPVPLFKDWVKIHTLDLRGTQVNDAGLDHLKKVVSL